MRKYFTLFLFLILLPVCLMGGGCAEEFRSMFEANKDSYLVAEPGNAESTREGVRPVIVIPGIMGTILTYGGEVVWPPVNLNLIRSDMPLSDIVTLTTQLTRNSAVLRLEADLSSVYKVIPYQMSPVGKAFADDRYHIGTLDTYRELCAAAAETAGENNVFFFGYDWRLDNEENGKMLKAYIESVCKARGVDRVNVVAHSMGGIVLSCYLKDCLQQKTAPLVDIAVTVGTPFLGSEYAAQVIDGCVDSENLMDRYFGDELLSLKSIIYSAAHMVKNQVCGLSDNYASVYSLMPFSAYERLGFVKDGTLTDMANPAARQAYALKKALAGQLSAIWRTVRHYNIAGVDIPTLDYDGTVGTVRGPNRTDTAGGDSAMSGYLEYTDGDGTVTFRSARADILFSEETKTFSASHTGLVDDPACLSYIKALLSPEKDAVSVGSGVSDGAGKEASTR